MTIRHACSADLDALDALEQHCFPPEEAATRASFARRLAVFPEHFWIVEENGRILACVNGCVSDAFLLQDEMFEDATLHNEQGAWQMLFGVETHPNSRGKGYASALMRQMIADAKAQGRRGVVLTCKQELLDFYRRFGFENEGVSASQHGGAVWYDMRLRF